MLGVDEFVAQGIFYFYQHFLNWANYIFSKLLGKKKKKKSGHNFYKMSQISMHLLTWGLSILNRATVHQSCGVWIIVIMFCILNN